MKKGKYHQMTFDYFRACKYHILFANRPSPLFKAIICSQIACLCDVGQIIIQTILKKHIIVQNLTYCPVKSSLVLKTGHVATVRLQFLSENYRSCF